MQTQISPRPGELLLIDVTEAARRLGVSRKTLWAKSKDQTIPSIKIGRRRLFSPAALARWIDEQGSHANM